MEEKIYAADTGKKVRFPSSQWGGRKRKRKKGNERKEGNYHTFICVFHIAHGKKEGGGSPGERNEVSHSSLLGGEEAHSICNRRKEKERRGRL